MFPSAACYGTSSTAASFEPNQDSFPDMKKSLTSNRLLPRILLVDDDEDLGVLYKNYLESEGFAVSVATSLSEMGHLVVSDSYAIVLLDLFLAKESGLEGIPVILRESPTSSIVILTGNGSIDRAVAAIDKGANAFLLKSDPLNVIAQRLHGIVTSKENLLIGSPTEVENYGMIGRSQEISHTLRRIELFKEVDSTVMIYGESGTGKELVAKALHTTSPRSKGNYSAINCGAIPETLLESELFGYKKGAFTDAKADRKGLFEYCTSGTLFLDEVGEIPLSLQVKLLRVLQEKEVVPIGSNTTIKVDTRIVAATNRDLRREVANGRFREDLYFRLNILDIKLPPLRKRISDIPLLVNHFMAELGNKYNKKMEPLNKRSLLRLKAYDWPGNVRELRNMIERGVVMARDGVITVEDMFGHLHYDTPTRTTESHEDVEVPFVDGYPVPFTEAKQKFERSYLKKLLAITGGNIAESARISGQYRANLYRMLQKYEIDIHKFKSY